MARRDKRRRRGRLVLAGAIIALALLMGWCGRGWFGAGDGDGASRDDSSTEPPRDKQPETPAPARCQLRVDADGVVVDGERADVAAAVAACKPLGQADLVVTGDAVYGTVQQLESALDAAGVRVFSDR